MLSYVFKFRLNKTVHIEINLHSIQVDFQYPGRQKINLATWTHAYMKVARLATCKKS